MKAGIYASDHCVQRKIQQKLRNDQILAGLEAENDLGQVFNLLDLAQRGVSNMLNRRNELMTRIAGFQDYAKAHGDIAIFITLTAPSKYHSFHSKSCRPIVSMAGLIPMTHSNTSTPYLRVPELNYIVWVSSPMDLES